MADLEEDLARLTVAVLACQGRVDADVLDGAQKVIERAGRRLALSKDATVVALVGATGSGKSSVFNAVTRTALAEPGIMRPMTQQAMAVTFGDCDTSALLDWLGVANRHVLPGGDLAGIVLLDLVDHDSITTSHQEEVDRLLEVVDQFLWVVDPQKYADAILHEHYLRRLVDHGNVMAFVLNQIDRLVPEQAAQVRQDFLRLLGDDGLKDPLVFEVSALTGQGIDALRRHIAEVASSKQGIVSRLEDDVLVQAKALKAQVDGPVGPLNKSHLINVTQACMEVAGVEQIGQAVRGSLRMRGRAATGWPLSSWLSRLKPDPLKRLHLDQFRSRKTKEPPELTRSSIVVHPVSRARMDTVMRQVGDDVSSSLPRLWRGAMDHVIKEQAAALPGAIDQAVVSTDLGLSEKRRWWTVVRVFQWMVLAVAIIGLGWLATNFVLTGFLLMPALPTFPLGALPMPTWIVIVSVAVGLLLAGISRLAVAIGAKSASVRAVGRLRKAMERVAITYVITPIDNEIERHDHAQEVLDQILR